MQPTTSRPDPEDQTGAAVAQEDPRIAAGVADLAAAAAQLRDLVADSEEPGTTYDAAWPAEVGR